MRVRERERDAQIRWALRGETICRLLAFLQINKAREDGRELDLPSTTKKKEKKKSFSSTGRREREREPHRKQWCWMRGSRMLLLMMMMMMLCIQQFLFNALCTTLQNSAHLTTTLSRNEWYNRMMLYRLISNPSECIISKLHPSHVERFRFNVWPKKGGDGDGEPRTKRTYKKTVFFCFSCLFYPHYTCLHVARE